MQTSFLRGIIYPIGYEKRAKEMVVANHQFPGRIGTNQISEKRTSSNPSNHVLAYVIPLSFAWLGFPSTASVRVSLLAISACRVPKCCVGRSPFSFCQPELLSVVSDRPAGSSLSQSYKALCQTVSLVVLSSRVRWCITACKLR